MGYSPSKNFSFAENISVIPILHEETSLILGQMCLAFKKRIIDNKSIFELVGLQSLSSQKNLFILPDGRWIGGYKPAYYRAYPFSLLPTKDSHQLQLSIDSEAVSQDEEKLCFFAENQTLTPHLQNITKFLTESLRSRQATLTLCQELSNANLIEPWPITFTELGANNKRQEKTLEGLHHINIKALHNLTAEQITPLNASGALSLAYGQHFSEARLKDLAERETAFKKMEDKLAEQHSQIEDLELDDLFDSKDDLFSF